MGFVNGLGERLRALFGKGRMDAEMDEELRFHLEQETEKNLRAGMSPKEARRQAILAFGGVERTREQTREGRGVAPLENLFRDFLFAFRSLRRVPGVVVVTVVSLGLGIAVSSIVFAVSSGFLFGDPGPIRDPSTLVAVYSSEPDGRLYGETSFPDYLDMAAETQVLEELTAHRAGVLTVGDPAGRDRIIVELVTGEYFRTLGTQPALGRGFLPEETVPGRAERVVVLSHSTWMDRYGGDPGVLGERVTLDGFPFTIIGVAPEGLKGRLFGFEVDGWLPLGIPGGTYRATPERMADRASRQFLMVGRLASGRTLEEAQAEFSLMASRFHEAHGELWEDQHGRPRSITVLADREARVPPDGRAALMGTAGLLLGGAFLILLLACTNVASLLLARAHRRARELAVRTSLGASRGRLLRLLLSESLALALLGGALGLYLTTLATGYLGAVPFPMNVPLRFEFHVDQRVVLFTLTLAMAAAVLAGMGPALQGSRADLTLALKNDAGRLLGRSRRFTLRNVLVVFQVFAALTLLVGAGLAVRSMRASADFNPGLDPDRVAVVWKEPPQEEMAPEDLREFFLEMGNRIAAEAEVEAVALARVAEAHPFMEDFATALVERREGDPLRIRFNAVTPGYLEMLSIPLARGRSIEPGDVEGAFPVAVVNQAFVDRFLQGTSGVGAGFTVRSFFDSERLQERPPVTFQVVGVVAPRDQEIGSGESPFFWISFLQDEPVRAVIHAKGRTSAEAVVSILRREVPPSPENFTLIEAAPYRDYVDYRFLGHRIVSRVLGFSGTFALLLAIIGVYGIVSFTVTQRLREMAIRQAVGARKSQVIRSAVASGLRPTMVGVVLGLLVVIPLAFLSRSVLLGVLPLDPIAVGGGTSLLIAAAALAGLVPARRLLSTEPMETLRED